MFSAYSMAESILNLLILIFLVIYAVFLFFDLGFLDVISFSQHVIGWEMGKIVKNLEKAKNENPIVSPCLSKVRER